MSSLFNNSGFFQNLFNAIPSPLCVVDSDVRIVHHNYAASQLIGEESVYMKRGGDALHCINAAKDPKGCGHAAECKECVIRNSVREAFQGGKVYRKKTVMTLLTKSGNKEVHVLVTSAPFSFEAGHYAMLIIEDISELLQLRSLLPICAWCKKIRNDQNYWQSIEEYFGTHHDLEFSHGMCEDCYKKYLKEFS